MLDKERGYTDIAIIEGRLSWKETRTRAEHRKRGRNMTTSTTMVKRERGNNESNKAY